MPCQAGGQRRGETPTKNVIVVSRHLSHAYASLMLYNGHLYTTPCRSVVIGVVSKHMMTGAG
jgi:hypothetical protein